jgi:hypothetical protein
MLRSATTGHIDDQTIALEAHAARAGAAMACVYSSSAEYDAALIAERRAAGIYGPRRHQKLVTGLAIAAGLTVVVLLIV